MDTNKHQQVGQSFMNQNGEIADFAAPTFLYSTGELAALFRRSPHTIRRWAKSRKDGRPPVLTSVQLVPGGPRFYPANQFLSRGAVLRMTMGEAGVKMVQALDAERDEERQEQRQRHMQDLG